MDTLELFTIKELSAYINVKPKTLYQWVRQRIVPCYRVCGILRFKKSEIDSWLERQHQSTQQNKKQRNTAIEEQL